MAVYSLSLLELGLGLELGLELGLGLATLGPGALADDATEHMQKEAGALCESGRLEGGTAAARH